MQTTRRRSQVSEPGLNEAVSAFDQQNRRAVAGIGLALTAVAAVSAAVVIALPENLTTSRPVRPSVGQEFVAARAATTTQPSLTTMPVRDHDQLTR